MKKCSKNVKYDLTKSFPLRNVDGWLYEHREDSVWNENIRYILKNSLTELPNS